MVQKSGDDHAAVDAGPVLALQERGPQVRFDGVVLGVGVVVPRVVVVVINGLDKTNYFILPNMQVGTELPGLVFDNVDGNLGMK